MKKLFSVFCLLLIHFVLFSDTGSTKIGFEENKGQLFDQNFAKRSDVFYYGFSGPCGLFLRKDGHSYQFVNQQTNKNDKRNNEKMIFSRIDVDWMGTNSFISIVSKNTDSELKNYYNVSCPEGVSVRASKNVIYQNIYHGIDLNWGFENGNFKYEFSVKAGVDYKIIKCNISGCDSIYVNKKGELVLTFYGHTIVEAAPVVIQNTKNLMARWHVDGHTVSYEIEGVDIKSSLIIDPLVKYWGTYFGGMGNENIWDSHVDQAGNIYVTGETLSSANIATSGAFQTVLNSTLQPDAFIAKYSPSGSRIWSTYYGGSDFDYGHVCFTDNFGNIYMAGGTSSTNTAVIATPGAHQTNPSGATSSTHTADAFLVKFDASGLRLWGTYYGGNGDDWANSGCIDGNNNVCIVGGTKSTDGQTIASAGAFQPGYGGGLYDGFVAKFNSNGSRLWGTYFGGPSSSGSNVGWEEFFGCSIDAQGDIYAAGQTNCTTSSIIASAGAHQLNFGGTVDGLLVKFNTAGQRVWSTYYGGVGLDDVFNCSVNGNRVVLVGSTLSLGGTVIATPGSHQPTWGGGNDRDGYVAVFDLNGTRQWASYYGGTSFDAISDCSFNSNGDMILFGITSSTNAIATSCTYQDTLAGSTDLFICKLSSTGNRIWGTYVGASMIEFWASGMVDQQGDIIIAGQTSSTVGTISTSNGSQPIYGGGAYDGFLQKFDGCNSLAPQISLSQQDLIQCVNDTVKLSTNVCAAMWYTTASGGVAISAGPVFTFMPITSNTTFYVSENSCGTNSPRSAVQLTTVSLPTLLIVSSKSLVCESEAVMLSVSGASSYTWQSGLTTSYNFIWPPITSVYSVTGKDTNDCAATASFTQMVANCTGIPVEKQNTQILVYPNPTSGLLNIYSNYTIEDIEVFDVYGVRHKIIQINSNQIDFFDFTPGIYYLRFSSGSAEKKNFVIYKY